MNHLDLLSLTVFVNEPCFVQDGPEMVYHGCKMGFDVPRWLQHGFAMARHGSKVAQDGSKMDPNASKVPFQMGGGLLNLQGL